jgi:hypothetical protein
MNYDKKGHESNWEFDFRSQILSKQGSNEVRLKCPIHCWKYFFEDINYCFHIFKTNLIWEKYERPKFWDNKSPKENVTFGCKEKHKIYYKEGSGASSQRLSAM